MKKIFSTLFLISLVIGLTLPLLVSAQIPDSCRIVRSTGIPDCPSVGSDAAKAVRYDRCYLVGVAVDCPLGVSGGICCLVHTIMTITDWIFVVLVAVSVIFVIIGAITILMAGGDATKVTTGRSYIIHAVIGLALALLARAIPAIVRGIIT